jgi:hypothetical protein
MISRIHVLNWEARLMYCMYKTSTYGRPGKKTIYIPLLLWSFYLLPGFYLSLLGRFLTFL